MRAARPSAPSAAGKRGLPTLSKVQTTLAVIALLVALAALGVAITGRRAARTRRTAAESDLPHDAESLRGEVAALREEGAQSLRHVAVVRYDAFSDTGGQLSWSMTLLDDSGSGVVVTAIQGRAESRTYAKHVTDWRSDTQLSPEEEDAISRARG
jgi:hypothetical protein